MTPSFFLGVSSPVEMANPDLARRDVRSRGHATDRSSVSRLLGSLLEGEPEAVVVVLCTQLHAGRPGGHLG
jgi:hypothetical protein